PIAVSPRALERIAARRTPMPFSFDIDLVRQYWIQRPVVYHNTIPIFGVYALHEALRIVLEEGLEARWAGHAEAGGHFQAGIRERGLSLLADPAYQLPQLSAVCVPEGTDGKAVQTRLLREHGIEVGGGLGPGAPPIWRAGIMGRNANVETA